MKDPAVGSPHGQLGALCLNPNNSTHPLASRRGGYFAIHSKHLAFPAPRTPCPLSADGQGQQRRLAAGRCDSAAPRCRGGPLMTSRSTFTVPTWRNCRRQDHRDHRGRGLGRRCHHLEVPLGLPGLNLAHPIQPAVASATPSAAAALWRSAQPGGAAFRGPVARTARCAACRRPPTTAVLVARSASASLAGTAAAVNVPTTAMVFGFERRLASCSLVVLGRIHARPAATSSARLRPASRMRSSCNSNQMLW